MKGMLLYQADPCNRCGDVNRSIFMHPTFSRGIRIVI
jgi:hypothetical protein